MNTINLEELSKHDLIEIAWASGIIEGEGCFIKQKHARRLVVGMTDEDVIDRLQKVFNVGWRTTKTLASGKTLFLWTVSKRADLIEVCHLILPFLGKRRTKKAHEILDVV